MKVSTSVSLDPELLKHFRSKFPGQSLSSYLADNLKCLVDDKALLVQRIDFLNSRCSDLKISLEALESERDFYVKSLEALE